jgi:hypothetical protein
MARALFSRQNACREKVVRGVKREDSPLIEGMQIYHNYVCPHMGLSGKTPAEKAGIKVEGKTRG